MMALWPDHGAVPSSYQFVLVLDFHQYIFQYSSENNIWSSPTRMCSNMYDTWRQVPGNTEQLKSTGGCVSLNSIHSVEPSDDND